MAKKRFMRVHVECATSSGLRWLKANITGGSPPVGAIGANNEFVVFRPDKFRQHLDAAECKIVETLTGAKRKRRR